MFSALQSRVSLMASQNMGECCVTKLDLPVGQGAGKETASNSSSQLHVCSRKGLLESGNLVSAQDPALEESLQPEDQSQPTANEEGDNDLLRLPFLKKLWMIAHNKAFESVNWSEDGDNIVIEVDMFQREVLQHRDARKIFEIESFKNFICQLYMHGFRKIDPENSALRSGDNSKTMVYYNFNFQRDKPELLENIERSKWRNAAQVCEAQSLLTSGEDPGPSPMKMKLLPTKHSPWLHKAKEGGMKLQQAFSNKEAPAGNLSKGPSCPFRKSNIPHQGAKGVATDLLVYPDITELSQSMRFHSSGSPSTADIARKFLGSS
nr:heat shock transcription factor, X-linked member 3 [Rattus norvegicus]